MAGPSWCASYPSGARPNRPGLSAMLRAMDGDLRVTSRLVIPAGELRERFSRSSGPGGQGVNTTDSRVELSFDVQRSTAVPDHLRARMLERLDSRLVAGVVTVAASEFRAQLANRQAARSEERRVGKECRS